MVNTDLLEVPKQTYRCVAMSVKAVAVGWDSPAMQMVLDTHYLLKSMEVEWLASFENHKLELRKD